MAALHLKEFASKIINETKKITVNPPILVLFKKQPRQTLKWRALN